MKQGGIKDIAQGRFDIFRLAPTDLYVKPGWNCRDVDFDPTDGEDIALALSIAEEGVKEALTVVWEGAESKAYVTNGHRRLAATLYAMSELGADIKSVPVQTENRASSEADRVFSQIIRNAGKPLSPLEQGRVFKKLLGLGWDEKEIARKSGKSENWIKQMLDLQSAPQAVTEMVRAGAVSASLAAKAVRSEGAAAAAETLGQAVSTAAAAGKSRATAKHMPNKKPAAPGTDKVLKQTKDILDRAKVDDADDGVVTVVFTEADFEILRDLFKL